MAARKTSRKAPAAPAAAKTRSGPLVLNLALQGGGSHGAFTWGVLDRLLDDDGLLIEAVSGTSAGALNGAVLATGMALGGRAGAQAALQAFWLDVAGQQSPYGSCFGAFAAFGAPGQQVPALSGMPAMPGPNLAHYNLDWNPFYALGNQFLRAFSPYQFNPLGDNPLRAVLARHVQPALLQQAPLQLHVTATAVRSGQPRVFSGGAISIDALLASTCLPQLFRAVHIDGQPYWDGGYSGNPAIWPLIYNSGARDILLVKINPLLRPDLPGTPAEIADRVNELTFNAGLIGEMRAIDFVQRLLAQGRIDGEHYKHLHLHMVADEDGLAALHPSSKLNTDRRFLLALRDLGRVAAHTWLQQHRGAIGRRSTLDVRKTFLEPRADG